MKTLVITEKPSMTQDIVQALRDREKFVTKQFEIKEKNGRIAVYYESDNYVIANAVGHVYRSKMPGDYPMFGKWRWEGIPFYPPGGKLEYIPYDEKKTLARNLTSLFKRKDIKEVINACDAGREGSIVFDIIYQMSSSKLPVKRLWTSSLVKEAVLKAFQNLRDESFIAPRREEGYARQFADWALGNNLTVGFTLLGGGDTLHIGRVQTPTLAILVKRKQEIENFQSKDYFEVKVNFGGKYDGLWFKEKLGNTKFDEKGEAERVALKVRGKQGTITQKETKTERANPKELYNLSQLQVDANKKYGFSAEETLKLAQTLYEKYKFLSYPRTSSNYIGTEDAKELKKVLGAITDAAYLPYVQNVLGRNVPTGKHFVDDSKLSDHHALIPTVKKQDLNELNGDSKATELRQLYDLVVRRFLAVFYPATEYERTTIITESEGDTFKTTGKIMVKAGWKEVYGDSDSEDDKDELIAPVQKGESNPVARAEVLAKQTKPPEHYTEGQLIEIMEDPRKLVQDDELKQVLKERGAGLGTEATRAGTIRSLKDRGYVALVGKGKKQKLVATKRAEELIAIAPKELVSPDITASWEKKLLAIQEGKLRRNVFEEEIKQYVAENLRLLQSGAVKANITPKNQAVDSGFRCLKCSGRIAVLKYKDLDYYVCENHKKEAPCVRVYELTLGKKLTKTQIEQLLEKGETSSVIKGLKNQKGNKYDAKVKYDLNEMRCIPVFSSTPKVPATETNFVCPFCKGEIVEWEKKFGCRNWKTKNCAFTVWKNGKAITSDLVRQLIQNGKTDVVEVEGPKGKFKACFVLDSIKKEVVRERG